MPEYETRLRFYIFEGDQGSDSDKAAADISTMLRSVIEDNIVTRRGATVRHTSLLRIKNQIKLDPHPPNDPESV